MGWWRDAGRMRGKDDFCIACVLCKPNGLYPISMVCVFIMYIQT